MGSEGANLGENAGHPAIKFSGHDIRRARDKGLACVRTVKWLKNIRLWLLGLWIKIDKGVCPCHAGPGGFLLLW
jgi:hypothetical protein